MKVPLVQATLHAQYKQSVTGITTGELTLYAFLILPYLNSCNPDDATAVLSFLKENGSFAVEDIVGTKL